MKPLSRAESHVEAKAPVRVKVLEEAAVILRQNGCTVSLVNAPSLFPPVKLEQRHPHGRKQAALRECRNMLLQLWRQIFNIHKQRRPLWLLKVTEEEGKTQLEHLDS